MAEKIRRYGALRDRFDFQARQSASDGWGGTVPGAGLFVTQFRADANVRPLRGGEQALASRLASVQPYAITVRWSQAMLKVAISWQLVDVRNTARVLNVVSVPVDPDDKRQWLEFLATDGVSQ